MICTGRTSCTLGTDDTLDTFGPSGPVGTSGTFGTLGTDGTSPSLSMSFLTLAAVPWDNPVSFSILDNGYFIFKVIDNGIGIPKNDIPRIFERFYRVDKSRCRNTGGTGVGLTICKSIVDLHKGKIEVKSKLNEGSEFIITLPN